MGQKTGEIRRDRAEPTRWENFLNGGVCTALEMGNKTMNTAIETQQNFSQLNDVVSAFPNAMDKSTLHGFLTGVALGPYEIFDQPWLELALGLPENTSVKKLAGSNMELLASEALDDIIDDLLDGVFEPLVDKEERYGVTLPRTDLWCQGFVDSVRLVEQGWEDRTEENIDLGKLLLFVNMIADPPRYTDLLFAENIDPNDVGFLAEVRSLVGASVSKMADYVLQERMDEFEADDGGETEGRDETRRCRLSAPAADFAAEQLAAMAPQDLMNLIGGLGEELPRTVIDECVSRTPSMLPLLMAYLDADANWSAESPEETWWGLLHSINILGAMSDPRTAEVLLRVMGKMEAYPENELWDWLNGFWPALFRNKREAAQFGLRAIADDALRGYATRIEAMECLLEAAAARSEQHLEAALDRLAELALDRSQSEEMAYQAALLLLDFPRERHRALLESFVQRQKLALGDIVYFSTSDIEAAFEEGDKRDWEQFDNPWELYESATADEHNDGHEGRSPVGDAGRVEPGSRRPSNIRRDDDCPCGSGKKYEKCCLH